MKKQDEDTAQEIRRSDMFKRIRNYFIHSFEVFLTVLESTPISRSEGRSPFGRPGKRHVVGLILLGTERWRVLNEPMVENASTSRA